MHVCVCVKKSEVIIYLELSKTVLQFDTQVGNLFLSNLASSGVMAKCLITDLFLKKCL